MIEVFGTIGLLFAMAGCLLNNRKMISCFPVWMVANIVGVCIHYHLHLYSFVVKDLFFMYICVDGYIRWRKMNSQYDRERKK